jgi:hypothetical protein
MESDRLELHAAGFLERDQQKWVPVLRPIALKYYVAHDLVAKPLTLWRIMRR